MPMLKVLGMRYRRPYQCRHNCTTAMLMAGMNLAFCAE
jgi:integrase